MISRIMSIFLLVFLIACASQRMSDWQKGKQQIQNEDYRAAIAAFEQDLLRHPEHYEAQCLIGYAHEKLGDHDAAIKAYAKTIALNPVNACAFIGFGRIYAAEKQWSAAWDAVLQARGVEANEALLALYPLFCAAADAGEFIIAPAAAPVAAPPVARTVVVSVVVSPATIKTRQTVAVSAAIYQPQNSFETAFYSALAATAGERIAQCHDRFFSAGRPASLDAQFTLMLRSDGTVDVPAEAPGKRAADMKGCVATALSAVRFPALPGTD